VTPVLLQLPYSPWSERARWALDTRGIDYKQRRYQPLLGELELRRRLGRWRGPVSVPVLITDDDAIGDSVEIARWADAHGSGPTLFPSDEVVKWAARSQAGLAAGRAVSLTRVLAMPDAIDELSPPWARKLGGIGRAVTRAGVARTRRKYGGLAQTDAEHQAALQAVLDELRAALGGRPTILDAFSFADIAMAQVLCFVAPPDRRYVKLGKANAAAFGDPELAQRYADLVAWRDALYARFREAMASKVAS
jgi:glutathione S-transferase